ncbi:hypothetical protein DIPPA_25469 [Diplonema papillatum]|nr:hypothetical protein DIPPA_25469 [Diplonema papillatum]
MAAAEASCGEVDMLGTGDAAGGGGGGAAPSMAKKRKFNEDKARASTAKRRAAQEADRSKRSAFSQLLGKVSDNGKVFVSPVPLLYSGDTARLRALFAPHVPSGIAGVSFPRVSPALQARDAKNPGKVHIYAFLELEDPASIPKLVEAPPSVTIPGTDAAVAFKLPQYYDTAFAAVELAPEPGLETPVSEPWAKVTIGGLAAAKVSEGELRRMFSFFQPRPVAVAIKQAAAQARTVTLHYLSATEAQTAWRVLDGNDYADAAAFGRCDLQCGSPCVLSASLVM